MNWHNSTKLLLFILFILFFTPSYRYISCSISINIKLLKRSLRKLEWRRAQYSKTNHGPLTRLTLFYCSFVIH